MYNTLYNDGFSIKFLTKVHMTLNKEIKPIKSHEQLLRSDLHA